MMNGNDYDLSKLAYREWQERVNQFYEPIKLPAFVRWLLAALRSGRREGVLHSDVDGASRRTRAGAVAR
jgi:hypothetical protein